MLFVSLISEILTERDAKAIFFPPFIINNQMKSEAQTINKPSQVYKKSNKNEMQSYPTHYYKEIVKFLSDSSNWFQ